MTVPAWLVNLMTQFGLAALKWAVTETANNLAYSKELAEKERLEGIRNGKNAQAYFEAKTRAEQIKAALNLINSNSV